LYKIGIDVGGTFTDIVVQDDIGALSQGKVSSTPGQESEGVLAALTLMGDRVGEALPDFLSQTSVINFGTTVATNAMLQHKGVPVAMITTGGFRDIVELRRGYKEVLFDIRLAPPQAIVPRQWRLGVAERIGAEGEIIVPLDEGEVRAAAKSIKNDNIQSIAICFLTSYLNSIHERRAREIVNEVHPEAAVYLSSEVLPKVREYERFSTTLVNAFISPLLQSYLDDLMAELRGQGFTQQLLVMQSNGGNAAPEFAGKLGCAALLSGPAGGVAAASRLGEACGSPSVIGVDMGGTSYDVCLIRDATPNTRSNSWFSRHHIGLPMLDIHTIGAGGGSIAWVDPGGALLVGPQSAGARPGPACYGFGGRDATVTDAFLHLGYLNPAFFLGGRMQIDADAARDAIVRNIGDPLDMDADEAAFSIFRIVNNNMSNGIRYVSVAEGHDPRDFALMSFGGAGSVTVGIQARDLGISRILVPRMASVLCALGELLADLRVTQIQPLGGQLSEIDTAALAGALDRLAATPVAELEQLDGVDRVRIQRHAEMRYAGQVHELPTPMPSLNGTNGADMGAVLAQTAVDFHELHDKLYAFKMAQKPVEIIAVRQDLVGERSWSLPQAEVVDGADASAAIKSRRRVCFPVGTGFNWVEAPVYDGALLRPGNVLSGPAVIEEVDTTIVIQPGDTARLNGFQVFEIDVDLEDAADV